jgi:hypothetical protein
MNRSASNIKDFPKIRPFILYESNWTTNWPLTGREANMLVPMILLITQYGFYPTKDLRMVSACFSSDYRVEITGHRQRLRPHAIGIALFQRFSTPSCRCRQIGTFRRSELSEISLTTVPIAVTGLHFRPQGSKIVFA